MDKEVGTKRERFLTAGEAYTTVFFTYSRLLHFKEPFYSCGFSNEGDLGENKIRCQSCNEHTNRERCLLLNMSGDRSFDTSLFGLEVNGERQKARERGRDR